MRSLAIAIVRKLLVVNSCSGHHQCWGSGCGTLHKDCRCAM